MSLVDDDAIGAGATPCKVVETATAMAEVAACTYIKFGIPLNFSKGKSEAWTNPNIDKNAKRNYENKHI